LPYFLLSNSTCETLKQIKKDQIDLDIEHVSVISAANHSEVVKDYSSDFIFDEAKEISFPNVLAVYHVQN
jgi:hypothetical protein